MVDNIDYEAHSHYGDDVTSLEAAENVDTAKQTKRVLIIFFDERDAQPLSDFDLQYMAENYYKWHDSLSGLGSRRGTLAKAGYLEKVDREGQSPRGNKAARFQITQKGIDLFQEWNKAGELKNV